MSGARVTNHRCVLGENMYMPNRLTYLQPLSVIKKQVWVGYCEGDKSHSEHFVLIKKLSKWKFRYRKTDIFKKQYGKPINTRLFDRVKQLKCPTGKSYMSLQKVLTNKLNMEHVDIYECMGAKRGKGHKPHLTKLQHGVLEAKINKKRIGVLIITIESD